MKTVNRPNCGTLPDFGNFRIDEKTSYDRYQGVEELMPFAKAVSAKSYDFDAQGNCIETDYRRMLAIVAKHGYRGWLGIEYEGEHRPEAEGVRLTQELIRRINDELA